MTNSTTKINKTNKIIAVIILLIFWQITAFFFPVKFLLCSPFSVVIKLLELIKQSSFWINIAFSTLRILCGLIISIAVSITLSVISHKNSLLLEINNLISDILKSTPITIVIIILLILFSNRYISLVSVFIATFPIIYTNFLEGIYSTDEKLLEMAQIFDFSNLKKYKYLYLPSAKSYLISGVKISSGIAWKAGIAGEIIGMPENSIGNALQSAKIFLSTEVIFSYAIIIILLSKLSLILLNKTVQIVYDTFTEVKK